MIIRVRSNVGIWRVEVGSSEHSTSSSSTPQDILTTIQQTRPHVVYESPLCTDPACTIPLELSHPLKEQNVGHGSMIYCKVDPSTCLDISASTTGSTVPSTNTLSSASSSTEVPPSTTNTTNTNMRRIIDAEGRIKLVPSNEHSSKTMDRGFRKGMMALGDMKRAWTLNEFMALDAQYEFKLQRQESSICQKVSLDIPSIANFQEYLQRFAFQQKRFGILYGQFVSSLDNDNPNDKDKDTPKYMVKVEAIYEPPQQPDREAAEGFEQLEDPLEDTVEQIAKLCGLTKVGWIFGHAPRNEGVTMTAAEIIMAAELQLEAAEGVHETPFCTIKVTKGKDGNVSVEAFQVSQQCMAMVAEEALEIGTDESVCVVNETFTAIQEGKESKTVENSFFLTVVPIVQHTSQVFVSQFPRMNRPLDDAVPSKNELKKQLSRSGTQGWTFMDLLADFNLLVYLAGFLDLTVDMPKICYSVLHRDVPLDDGYKIIIAAVAGLDGAY